MFIMLGWICFMILVAVLSSGLGYLAYGFSVMMGFGRVAPVALGILAAALVLVSFFFVSI